MALQNDVKSFSVSGGGDVHALGSLNVANNSVIITKIGNVILNKNMKISQDLHVDNNVYIKSSLEIGDFESDKEGTEYKMEREGMTVVSAITKGPVLVLSSLGQKDGMDGNNGGSSFQGKTR